MLLQSIRSPFAPLAILALCVAVSSPALAAGKTYYSWRTEDGTYAFTDDPKRIPANYKDVAEKKTLGKLKDYKLLTPSDKFEGAAYGERMAGRLDNLRSRQSVSGPPAVSAPGTAAPQAVYEVSTGMGRFNSSGLRVPVPVGASSGNQEPVISSNIRVKSRHGNATQHANIVTQGDRVVSVTRGQNNNRNVTPRRERDLYGEPALLERR